MLHPEAGEGLEHVLPTESASRVQAMLDHLASGCTDCSEALSWLARQRLERGRFSFPSPPDHAVEAAKDAFTRQRLVSIDRPCRKASGGFGVGEARKKSDLWVYQLIDDSTLLS